MKKHLAALLCCSALLLPVTAQENLLKDPSLASGWWSKIGKGTPTADKGIKVTLTRKRKLYTDGGVVQRYHNPKKGFYNLSVSYRGSKIHTLSFWNMIRLKSGKLIYRVKTFSVTGDLKDFRKADFTFDLPENVQWVHVQITGRAKSSDKDAVLELKNPVLKSVPAPKNVKASPAPAPAAVVVNVNQYLPGVINSIPKSHPRLFYNARLMAQMKAKAKTPELAPYIKKVKNNCLKSYASLLKYYKEDDGLGPNEPLSRRYHPLEKWGQTAGNCALLYYLTGEKKWADMAIDLMKKLTPWYNKRFDRNRAVSWYGWGRINTVMAWDWLYNVMDKETRDSIAKEMISHGKRVADRSLIARLCPLGEGLNGPGSGFYSAHCMLPWYLGIVFRGEGYDNKFVDSQLRSGLQGHLEMLTNRNNMAGDDGGSVNSTPAYCYGTYNNVEFYFFLSYLALTGKNIASDFKEMGLFPFWLSYTIFKGIDGRTYDFGTGGAWHTHNIFSAPSAYHSLYRNFYTGPLADVSDEIHKNRPWSSWTEYDHLLHVSPLFLFFKKCDLKNVKDNSAFYRSLPKGYFFERLGQVYMHSGRERNSTRVMFTCGAKSPSHKENDENHFVIYKGGFLALDAGTRTADFSKEGRDLYYAHDNMYKCQSVAHNVVLIRMEGEKFKTWRFDPKKMRNHAGMNKSTGGIVRAYETNNDFTYVAGDSTACYHPGKSKLVVRQFVMIYPDLFVIYDTVKSVKADQKKTWLLHTQEEPLVQGNMFSVIQREGRLFCRTLLPENASLVKIGGPGKEFFVEGKNYHPGDYINRSAAAAKKRGFDAPLWGHYRMEVSQKNAAAENSFLHVIQVGMKDSFKKMIDTKLVKKGTMEGASFRYNGVDYTITFDRAKVPSGHIKAVKNGKVLYNRALTNKVQAQRAMDYLK